jgi:hypothetical protein
MIFAQSLLEYGALDSLASELQHQWYSISTWLGTLSTTEWIIAAIVVFGLFRLTRR